MRDAGQHLVGNNTNSNTDINTERQGEKEHKTYYYPSLTQSTKWSIWKENEPLITLHKAMLHSQPINENKGLLCLL